ncbi:MAG: Crp/Fnr family transcriptional regulator [Bdellovibrionales bacterium]
MLDSMFKFMEKYGTLGEHERKIVLEANKSRKFSKREIVRSFADEDSRSFFILKGLAYSSVMVGEQETVVDFYFSGSPVLVPQSITNPTITYQLMCLEDSEIAVGRAEMVEKLIGQSPQFEKICRLFSEEKIVEYFEFQTSLKAMKAGARVEFIQKIRPGLIDKVPHFLFANYLGISPETLSRVRS